MEKQKNFDVSDTYHLLREKRIQGHFVKKLHHAHLHLEVLHHHLSPSILEQLSQLCDEQGFFDAITQWRYGLSTAIMPSYMFLRNFDEESAEYQQIKTMRLHMQKIAHQINSEEWLGYSKKPIRDIVNIGMGGSDLGPKFCYEALKSFQKNKNLRFHFISDADEYQCQETLDKLSPETTLFIVSSKSFTTIETFKNAKKAKEWLSHPQAMQQHFIAVTANPQKAREEGYQHVIAFGQWVIGRYSSTSAINLINAIAWGYEQYEAFLQGAHSMDRHFLNAPWFENLPMMLALVGMWNINFLNIPTHLMMIYDSRLNDFYKYVQQLDMESNGKSHNRQGLPISYCTAPIVWGGNGNQAQHSYYQLLAQGQHQVAIDFLSVKDTNNILMQTMCEHRKHALFQGIHLEESSQSIEAKNPMNHIELTELSPKSLGELIAMYEHKIFTQAFLWNLNPFDQPGVESAKRDGLE